jgi:hypothetical protein
MTSPLSRVLVLCLTAGLTLTAFGSGVVGAETPSSPLVEKAVILHLREIDLVHVFFVLNDLTAESFVVDSGVQGRFSVDLEHAMLEEALTAVRSAGVVVGPSALHRVSRAGGPPAATAPRPASYTGEKISVLLENVELANIVCALGGVPNLQTVEVHGLGKVGRERNPQFKVVVPRNLQGRVSIFSGYLPWDQILDGLLSPLGLISVLDENGLFVGPGPEASVRSQTGAVDACQMPSDPGPTSILSGDQPNLAVADLELVGLARKGDAWKAYAYAPGRRLLNLESGQKLRDASVTGAGPTGVTFTTDAKKVVNVSLRP